MGEGSRKQSNLGYLDCKMAEGRGVCGGIWKNANNSKTRKLRNKWSSALKSIQLTIQEIARKEKQKFQFFKLFKLMTWFTIIDLMLKPISSRLFNSQDIVCAFLIIMMYSNSSQCLRALSCKYLTMFSDICIFMIFLLHCPGMTPRTKYNASFSSYSHLKSLDIKIEKCF